MEVTMENFKKEQRRRERQEKINSILCDIQVFWANNKDWLMVVGPIAGAVALKVGGTVTKSMKYHHEAKMNDKFYNRQIWDPKNGLHITTKRSMTPRDKTNVIRLKEQGLSTMEALSRLNLV